VAYAFYSHDVKWETDIFNITSLFWLEVRQKFCNKRLDFLENGPYIGAFLCKEGKIMYGPGCSMVIPNSSRWEDQVLRDELPTKRAARKMSKAAYYAEHGDELRAKGRVRDAERRAAKKARREREHYVAML